MSIYKKLQEARVMLHKTQLNKSGKNKFAGYEYFELADFIPQVTDIFNKVGLCGIVSFTQDTGYLTVHETEGDGFVTFTSPLVMAENAKGQAIQSMGSTHTYYRRYLWLMCMEIIDNDIVDAGEQVEKPVKKVESKPVIPKAEPAVEPIKTVPKAETKPITGEQGEWQIVAPHPPEGDATDWLKLIHDSAMILLDLTANEEDVMQIFKKNKVLFDKVKATDAVFFKGMMAKFTERNNMFKKG